MKPLTAVIFVLIGPLLTFLGGVYGVVYLEPTRFWSAITTYTAISVGTLFPFLFLLAFINDNKFINNTAALGSIVIGVLGGVLYIKEATLPGYTGLFILIVPVIQFLCLLILSGALVALTKKSNRSRCSLGLAEKHRDPLI